MREKWKTLRSLTGNDRLRTVLQAGVVAGVVLLSFLYAVHETMTQGPYGTYWSPDETNYIEMARRLLSTGVYSFWGGGSDAYVSPGFPLFLTALMAVFGTELRGILCVKLVQCVLVAGTVGLTFLLGRLLTGKYSAGLIACLLVALNGNFTYYARRLLTENLYFFTMMLFFVLLVLAMQRDRLLLHALAGFACAVAVMVRPLVVVVVPFAYLPLILERWRQWKRLLLPAACFGAGFLLVCLPWWVRNLVQLHRFIPLATQTNPIYAGLAPDVGALGIQDPRTFLGNLRLLFRLLADNFTGTVYWMTFRKFQIIFMDEITTCRYPALTTLVRNITLYLGLFGGLRLLFRRESWGPALVFFVYFAVSFLFVPTARYAMQYMPLLAVMAGWLLVWMFTPARDKPRLADTIREGETL